MLQKCQLMLSFAVCLLLMQPFTGFAVEEFKVSEYGKGEQIWFEAEAFDERDSEDVYKLGKGEKAVDPADGAFGDIVTNAGGQGWILYRFDISRAGGKAGDWRFIGRVINPSNHSDWLWVLGDDGEMSAASDDGERQAYFEEAGGFVPCRVVNRFRLAPGDEVAGPAIIEERDSTTVVLPGDNARISPRGHLIITVSLEG